MSNEEEEPCQEQTQNNDDCLHVVKYYGYNEASTYVKQCGENRPVAYIA